RRELTVSQSRQPKGYTDDARRLLPRSEETPITFRRLSSFSLGFLHPPSPSPVHRAAFMGRGIGRVQVQVGCIEIAFRFEPLPVDGHQPGSVQLYQAGCSQVLQRSVDMNGRKSCRIGELALRDREFA